MSQNINKKSQKSHKIIRSGIQLGSIGLQLSGAYLTPFSPT